MKNPAAREYVRAIYRKNRLRWAGITVLNCVETVFALFCSWLLGALLDAVTAGSGAAILRLLVMTCVFLVLVFLLNGCCTLLKADYFRTAMTQYKNLAFHRLTEKSISAFSRENTGRYLSVLTNDANKIELNYISCSFNIVKYAVMFCAALGMMIWYDWRLAIAAVLLTLLPLAASVGMSGEMSRRQTAVSDENEHFVSTVKDLLSGFSVIKSFKAEAQCGALFESANGKAEHAKRREFLWSGLLELVGTHSGFLMQFGMFFLCSYFALRGSITVGTVVVFVNLCNFLIGPIQCIPDYIGKRRGALALIDKLADISSENLSRGGEKVEKRLSHGIELKDVSFAYQEGKPVLQNVSLRFEPGKSYAVVGASGSGKSTLLSLLMGAYDSYGGSITVDGMEMSGIDPDSLYDLMSLVGQSVFLFDDTIRKNITMFSSFPDEAVNGAAEKAGLLPVIAQRGEDYRCGENGVNLSGGERQRISIARSLLRGTGVLLVDEATAALDAETACHVGNAILDLEGLTRIVVTHRLEPSLLSRYDGIIVMKNGRVSETGRFDELMERKQQFYALYTVANG